MSESQYLEGMDPVSEMQLKLSLITNGKIVEVARDILGCSEADANSIGAAMYRKWVLQKPKQSGYSDEELYEVELDEAALKHAGALLHVLRGLSGRITEGTRRDGALGITETVANSFDRHNEDDVRASRRGGEGILQKNEGGVSSVAWGHR